MNKQTFEEIVRSRLSKRMINGGDLDSYINHTNGKWQWTDRNRLLEALNGSNNADDGYYSLSPEPWYGETHSYPDTTMLRNDPLNNIIMVRTKELLAIIKELVPGIRKTTPSTQTCVTLEIVPNKGILLLTHKKTTTHIIYDYTPKEEPLKINISSKYLRDALLTSSEDVVEIHYNCKDRQPIKIVRTESSDLIMPMRPSW